MILEKQTDFFFQHPKQLFLIDGFGALLSAFLLGVVLTRLESIFGIPLPTLYFLAAIPCFFALYDFYCFKSSKDNPANFLKAIAYANLLYCCISIVLAFYHYQTITSWGWIYILLEIMIVVALVYIELNVAAKLNARKG